MKIVSDSSILIHLSMIGCFYLLKKVFKNIIIPEAVYVEVVEEGWGLPGASEVEEATQSWIKIQAVVDRRKVKEISDKYKVNLANAEVIQLSREIDPDLVLVNEEEIRNALKEFGFSVKGCLGILLEAVNENFITSEKALSGIQGLIDSGYRIDESIVKSIEDFLRRRKT